MKQFIKSRLTTTRRLHSPKLNVFSVAWFPWLSWTRKVSWRWKGTRNLQMYTLTLLVPLNLFQIVNCWIYKFTANSKFFITMKESKCNNAINQNVSQTVSQLVRHQSDGQSDSQFVSQKVSQLVWKPFSQSINQPISHLASQSGRQLISE